MSREAHLREIDMQGHGSSRTLLFRFRHGTQALLMHLLFLLPSSSASFLGFRRPFVGALCCAPALCMSVEMSISQRPGAGLETAGLVRCSTGAHPPPQSSDRGDSRRRWIWNSGGIVVNMLSGRKTCDIQRAPRIADAGCGVWRWNCGGVIGPPSYPYRDGEKRGKHSFAAYIQSCGAVERIENLLVFEQSLFAAFYQAMVHLLLPSRPTCWRGLAHDGALLLTYHWHPHGITMQNVASVWSMAHFGAV